MTAARALAVLAVALAAIGCATAYGPKTVTGGYSETWRSPTELQVEFHHNDLHTLEDARQLAMRRAAELALESGYRYVHVWGERLHPQRVVGPQYASIQAQFLSEPSDATVDAVEVIEQTDSLAKGRLSSGARKAMDASRANDDLGGAQ